MRDSFDLDKIERKAEEQRGILAGSSLTHQTGVVWATI
jgi:hypothetical protein